MRVALNDAAPLYRDAPEAREARASGDRTMRVFMREALPGAAELTRALAAELHHDDAEQSGEAFLGAPSKPDGDRGLRRCDGRYALRAPRKPRARLRAAGSLPWYLDP